MAIFRQNCFGQIIKLYQVDKKCNIPSTMLVLFYLWNTGLITEILKSGLKIFGEHNLWGAWFWQRVLLMHFRF